MNNKCCELGPVVVRGYESIEVVRGDAKHVPDQRSEDIGSSAEIRNNNVIGAVEVRHLGSIEEVRGKAEHMTNQRGEDVGPGAEIRKK